MNKRDALKLASKIVSRMEPSSVEDVADMVVVYRLVDGSFVVTDNGERVAGLDTNGAIRVIVENLTGNY